MMTHGHGRFQGSIPPRRDELHYHQYDEPHFTPDEEQHIIEEVNKRFKTELVKLMEKAIGKGG
jgi:hypothetical protein